MKRLGFAAGFCLLAVCCTAFADGPAKTELLVPLSGLVDGVNAKLRDTRPHPEFATSEAEIVESIKRQLPNLNCNSGERSLLAFIAETKKVPANAQLDATASGNISLDVMLTENSGYRVLIRHPALEKQADGSLKLKSWERTPEESLPGTSKDWTDYKL